MVRLSEMKLAASRETGWGRGSELLKGRKMVELSVKWRESQMVLHMDKQTVETMEYLKALCLALLLGNWKVELRGSLRAGLLD